MEATEYRLMSDKVIAVLMPKGKRRKTTTASDGVQALIRREDGEVVLQDIQDTGVFRDEDIARFRRATEILDPETREVIGYEMEPISESA
jgi:hypothetical protein